MLIGHVAMQQTRTMLSSLQSLNASVDRIKVHSICIPIFIDAMPIECASGVDTPKVCKLALVNSYTVNLCAP